MPALHGKKVEVRQLPKLPKLLPRNEAGARRPNVPMFPEWASGECSMSGFVRLLVPIVALGCARPSSGCPAGVAARSRGVRDRSRQSDLSGPTARGRLDRFTPDQDRGNGGKAGARRPRRERFVPVEARRRHRDSSGLVSREFRARPRRISSARSSPPSCRARTSPARFARSRPSRKTSSSSRSTCRRSSTPVALSRN